jgi:hypothetical protein
MVHGHAGGENARDCMVRAQPFVCESRRP